MTIISRIQRDGDVALDEVSDQVATLAYLSGNLERALNSLKVRRVKSVSSESILLNNVDQKKCSDALSTGSVNKSVRSYIERTAHDIEIMEDSLASLKVHVVLFGRVSSL